MRPILLALLLVACKKPQPVPSAVLPDEAKPAPSVDQLQSVGRMLSVRDPEPDCATMEASIDADPVATWVYVVNTMKVPPYAPMRAAGCLISGHPEAATGAMQGWMRDPETQGLARLVLANLEKLPEPVAVDVVQAGLVGPLAETVAEAAAESKHTAVKSLVP